MQLNAAERPVFVRHRLSAAACMMIAVGSPVVARADAGVDTTATTTTTIDASGLIYSEKGRTSVVEPTVRVTRLFPNRQSLSGQVEVDAMTGASPTGSMPSALVQTTTSASGEVTTLPAGRIPLNKFQDLRGVLDLEWLAPLGGRINSTTGVHFSREKDYQSLGGSGQVSIDLMNRLTTVTLGAGFNRDRVFPVTASAASSEEDLLSAEGMGPRRAFPPATVEAIAADDPTGSTHSKRVASALVGISRVLSRRWMVAVNASRTLERGYLTEPYRARRNSSGTG